jgi:hypothetical protein
MDNIKMYLVQDGVVWNGMIWLRAGTGRDCCEHGNETSGSIKCWEGLSCINLVKRTKQAPWTESTSELYRPSDRRLSAKLVQTFADWGCRVVSVTDPYGRILGFLDRSHYFLFQIDLRLYSRGWVDPVPHPLLLRKSGSTGNRTRICLLTGTVPPMGRTLDFTVQETPEIEFVLIGSYFRHWTLCNIYALKWM